MPRFSSCRKKRCRCCQETDLRFCTFQNLRPAENDLSASACSCRRNYHLPVSMYQQNRRPRCTLRRPPGRIRCPIWICDSIQPARSLPRSRQASYCRDIFVSAANMDYSTSLMETGRCSCKDRAAAAAIRTGYSPSIPVTGGWWSWITASAKACISATKAPV